MKIYNTLSRTKEEFKPISPNEVKIYPCGPTVYDYIHIGNARPMCIFDILRRYLEYQKYKVVFVQNFTDIDDKIILRAKTENTDYLNIANRYISEYKLDAKGLNVKPPTIAPRATENIDQIIKIISELLNKGVAYESGGDIFFSVKDYKEYGLLSHMPMEDLESGARIKINIQKRSPLDFTLWKATKPGEPFWDSPWGSGRPGWHIECTAMINKIFGSTIDIHCGGRDLIFPHHENEIAQSKCYTNKNYASYWMHNGYINIDNKKMSKSEGNFFTVRDVAKKFGYPAIRLMMIQSHYRNPINYSFDVVEQCKSSLIRLKNCQYNLANAIKINSSSSIEIDQNQKIKLLNFKSAFIAAMDDDLNTADGLAVIFDLVTEININIINKSLISKEYLLLAQKIFDELTGVLAILYDDNENKLNNEIPEEIKNLVKSREYARKKKDFMRADQIREEILLKGYILRDTINGVVVNKQDNKNQF